MRWVKKWQIWLPAAVLLLAGAVSFKYWSQNNSAPQYKIAKIEKGAILASVAASGTLNPVVSVQVGSQVSGQLKEILVDFNSEVKQGQLIARIDPETFEYKVRQAQADLDAARAQVQTQQANIAAQRSEVARSEIMALDAKLDFERKQQLVDKGFISNAERDKARAVHNAAGAQVATARAQTGVGNAGLRNAEAIVRQRSAVLAQAKIDLERTAIKAPVNGVVIKRSVDKGQTVAASLQAPELFIIAGNLTDMRVDTAIDESEIGRVRQGQKATFTVDAFPGRTFEGEVRQIRMAAQNVSNVITYMVEVSADNPRRELLPGMTANVRIVTDSRKDVLKVPNAALRFKPAGAVAAGAGPAPGQRPPRTAAGDTGTQREAGGQSQQLRQRLERELQLSETQKTRLDALFAGLREKIAAARGESPAERQLLTERHRAELRSQITLMLTPEQARKFEAINVESQGGLGGGGRTGSGRIYLLDGDGQPREVNVRLGLTDGSMTEVVAPEAKEGADVIIGMAQPPGAAVRTGGGAGRGGPRMF